MEYGSNCWSPTSKKLNTELEMVHHNAAKFVSNKYPRKKDNFEFSITNILQNLNWETLEERRNQARITMAYKILNDKLILEPNMLPKTHFQRPMRQCNGVNVGQANQLVEPKARLDVTASTFFYETPKLWNELVTPKQANAPSVEAFKRHFKK